MTIDANMYWLPEELFTNEKMLEEFMRCIPEVYGVHARCEEIPGTTKKQIVLEEPKGCENLNYVQGEYRIEKQLKTWTRLCEESRPEDSLLSHLAFP